MKIHHMMFEDMVEFCYCTLQKTFEGLAKTAAFLSKILFEFVHGAANVWELHSAHLQGAEQQLQDSLKEVSKNFEEKNQVRLIPLSPNMFALRYSSLKFT